jgi:nucleoside 2-deoxyribosyltransferase
MKRIYLAGPDVFFSNASELGERKKRLCQQYGFIGLFPLDGEIEAHTCARDTGLAISLANEALIRECDWVIANLTPFRGASADVGTVYELGLARGLGKCIHGYSNDPTLYTQRVFDHAGTGTMSEQTAGNLRDKNGFKIEEFDLHDNLMIDGGIHAAGGYFLTADASTLSDDLALFERLLRTLRDTYSNNAD